MAITRVIKENIKTIQSSIFSRIEYEPLTNINQVIRQDKTTHISILMEGNIFVPASATAPTSPPIPIIAGRTPKNINQTSQEVVFPFIFVFGPGISAKASRKVFFVTTMYLLISA